MSELFNYGMEVFGGTILPPKDNTYDLGSPPLSWRNAYFQTAVYATSVVGNWSPSATGTYTLGTASLGWLGAYFDAASGADADIDILTAIVTGTPKLWWDESSDSFALSHSLIIADGKGITTGWANDDYFTIGAVDNDTNTITELLRFVGAAAPYTLASQPIMVADDILFKLGTTSDNVLVHRTAVLNADTNLTGVLVGASQDTSALAANSLIISNITSDGDILIAGSDGGHSKQALFFDSSAGVLHLGRPGTPGSATASGDVYIAGKFEVDGQCYFDTGWDIGGVVAGGATGIKFSDDIACKFGNSADAAFLYETADADAKILIGYMDESDDSGNNIPVFLWGEEAIVNVNLNWFPTYTEPCIAVANLAGDAYIHIGAGDINGSANVSRDGIYFKAAADEDINLLKLSVGGTPTFIWDESEDAFSFSNKVAVKKLGYGAEADVTIATGVIAVTQTYHSVIVEGGTGAADDDLTSATGGTEGDILILKANTTASDTIDQVTVVDGTGSGAFILAGGANFVLDHVDDRIMLIHNGTEWVELFRSSNS